MKLLQILLVCLLSFAALCANAQDRILKPLDRVSLSCEQDPSLNRDYVVTNDGFLLINFIGAIKVSGLKEDEAAQLIADQLVKQRILPQATVKVRILGAAKSSVSFRGAVKTFGEVPWRQDMRLSDLIKLAEPTRQADLSAIEIETTGGKKIVVNFVKWDGKTESSDNPPLQAGDIVTFPRLGRSLTVHVLGAVMNPGSIELTERMTIAAAIEKVGGLRPEADPENISFERDGESTKVVKLATEGPVLLRAGDRIIVQLIPRTESIYLTGGVKQPGTLSFTNGLTLMEAVKRAGNFLEGHLPNQAKVIRRDGQKQRTIKVDLKKIREGYSGDFPLMSGDRVEIPQPGGRRNQDALLRIAGVIIGIFLIGGS